MSAFLAIKQGNRGVDDYALAFRRALMLVGSMPEQLCVTHFTQGLHPSLASEVTRLVPDTLTDAIRLARWAEHSQKTAHPNNPSMAPNNQR